jgi:hypothetical protein
MVDLNTLISPKSPFYLYWAPFIDDHGEIGAFGALPDGDSHAVLLIPCDASRGDSECEDEGEGTAVGRGESQRSNVVMPDAD